MDPGFCSKKNRRESETIVSVAVQGLCVVRDSTSFYDERCRNSDRQEGERTIWDIVEDTISLSTSGFYIHYIVVCRLQASLAPEGTPPVEQILDLAPGFFWLGSYLSHFLFLTHQPLYGRSTFPRAL